MAILAIPKAFSRYHYSPMIFSYLLLGMLVGIISGIVGLGGGILIVPALVFFFGMSQHKAQGTSLAALLAPVGILAFFEYKKTGSVDLKAALLIALGYAIGGYFGGSWAQNLSEVALQRILGGLMLVIGIRFLFFAK